MSLSERVALAKAKAAARRAAAAESPPDDPTAPTAPAKSSSEATNPARPSRAATSSQERVTWAQAEALLREQRVARSRQTGAKAGASTAARTRWLGYGLRLALLLAAVAVVTWVYQGDVVLGVIVLICAAGVFARIVAAKVVPRIVGVVAATPFALGALIPLWNTADALLRQDGDALSWAALTGGLYLLAVLAIFRLPRSMGGPFQKWLP